jgi:molybdopterin synthase catalytic subunit
MQQPRTSSSPENEGDGGEEDQLDSSNDDNDDGPQHDEDDEDDDSPQDHADFDQEESDLLGEGLEHKVNDKPGWTCAFATPWQRGARDRGLSAKQIAAREKLEVEAFNALPLAAKTICGRPMFNGAMLDWKARRFLTGTTWNYYTIPKDDSVVRSKFLSSEMDRFMVRFPDYAPEHPKRQVEAKMGKKGLRAYVGKIRDWVTKNARRLNVRAAGPIVQLGAKARKAQEEFVQTMMGKTAIHHRWGSSKAGRAIVDPLIAEARRKWVEENPGGDVNTGTIHMYNTIRSKQFSLLPLEEQKKWEDQSYNPDGNVNP